MALALATAAYAPEATGLGNQQALELAAAKGDNDTLEALIKKGSSLTKKSVRQHFWLPWVPATLKRHNCSLSRCFNPDSQMIAMRPL